MCLQQMTLGKRKERQLEPGKESSLNQQIDKLRLSGLRREGRDMTDLEENAYLPLKLHRKEHALTGLGLKSLGQCLYALTLYK